MHLAQRLGAALFVARRIVPPRARHVFRHLVNKLAGDVAEPDLGLRNGIGRRLMMSGGGGGFRTRLTRRRLGLEPGVDPRLRCVDVGGAGAGAARRRERGENDADQGEADVMARSPFSARAVYAVAGDRDLSQMKSPATAIRTTASNSRSNADWTSHAVAGTESPNNTPTRAIRHVGA